MVPTKRVAVSGAALALASLLVPQPAGALDSSASSPAGARPATNEVLGDQAPIPARVQTTLSAADDARIERILGRMSLDEKIGQVFVVSFAGTSATPTSEASTSANLKALGVGTAAEAVSRYHVGGVIYFASNITSPQQAASLSGALQKVAIDNGAGIPLSISIDQEGGTVWRLQPPASTSPGNMAVGATGEPGHAYRAGRITGQEMRVLGINWNLAPVADVNTQPYNQVDGARSFGDDPTAVPAYVRMAVLGQRAGGVASAVKHFPGLGSSKANSDVAIARSSQTAAEFRSRDFPAFAAAIDADVETVLTAHLVAPKLVGSNRPTSLSHKVVTRILRHELGFRGAVITDTLQAAALSAIPQKRVVVEAFRAGNDMLLMPVNLPTAITALRAAVKDGRVPRERLDRSVRRILQMKLKAGMLDPPWRGSLADIGATVGTPDHLAAMSRIAQDAVTLIAPQGVEPPLSRTTGHVLVAGTGSTAVPQMAAALTARGLSATTMVTGFGATETVIAGAVAVARQSSAVVLLTYDVFGDSGQKRLIPRLIATGVPVIVVPIDGPYDAAWAGGAAAVVTSYGYTPTNLDAVAAALFGRRTVGALPVTVPAKGPKPRPVLYPRGWGLTWRG